MSLRKKDPSADTSANTTRTVAFGGGGANIDIPSNLQTERDSDGTISIALPGNTSVTLRLSLITFRAKDGTLAAGKAAEFVRERALKEGREVVEIAGWSASTEHKQSEEDGVPIQLDFWYIGADESLAIISLTTDVAARESPAARFFREALPRMLDSIHFAERIEFIETAVGAFPTRVTTVDSIPQGITEFGAVEREWLASVLRNAEQLAVRYDVPAGVDDLVPSTLDRIFARWLKDEAPSRPPDEFVSQGLGAAFGQYMVRAAAMRWVTVSDENGIAQAIRHERGSTMAFPVESVRKRVESGEIGFLDKIAIMLARQIEADSGDD